MTARPLYRVAVGEPYNSGRRHWPECSQYSYRAGAHDLVLFLGNPTPDEVMALHQGEAEFALVVKPPLIVLLHRFGLGLPWSDSPTAWHRVSPHERELPPEESAHTPDTRAICQVTMVDAGTGIVRALRQVSWSPEFTRAAHAALRAQAAAPWDEQAYDAALEALFRRFPDTEGLLLAATVRTEGGA